jgi:hypothetical protein
MSEGGKKKKKKDCPIHFLKKYIPQCLCRRRNKKNNHNFKVLILLIYFFQTCYKRMAVGHDHDETY